jgi:ABC-2 type transport system permease protein
MKKAWLVAKHEFISNVRRRSFLIGALGVPLFLLILFGVIIFISLSGMTTLADIGDVGYVDNAGILTNADTIPSNYVAFATSEEAGAALQSGDIGAYFIIPEDYLRTGDIRLVSSSSPPEELQDQISDLLIANLDTGLDAALVNRIIEPVNMSLLALDSGRLVKGDAIVGLFLAPMLFVVFFMIASQLTSSYLMGSVVEEKTTRVVEMLVTSIAPLQLLAGKIIGLGALGFLQIAIWVGVGYILLSLGRFLPFLEGVTIPSDMLIVAIVYFVLGYLLFSGIMAGIGAVVNSEQESRQIAGIFTLPLAIPFFFIFSFLTDPGSPVVVFLSIFPLTSPVGMLFRMGFGFVPPEQLALSAFLLLVTALFSVWASARVFRWSLLMYGKRPTVRQIFRAIRTNPGMATSATGDSRG